GRKRAVKRRQPADLFACGVEVSDERAVLIGNPEGTVGQRNQSFGVVAVGVRRENISVQIGDYFSPTRPRVDSARIRSAVGCTQRNNLFENGLAAAELELADSGVECRQGLHFRSTGPVHVGSAIGETVKLIARSRYRHKG